MGLAMNRQEQRRKCCLGSRWLRDYSDTGQSVSPDDSRRSLEQCSLGLVCGLGLSAEVQSENFRCLCCTGKLFTAMAKDSVSLQRNEKVTAVSTKVVGFYVSPDPFRKPVSLAHRDNSKRLRF